MRAPHNRHTSATATSLFLLLTLFLWGCADKPKKQQVEQPTKPQPEKPAPAKDEGISTTLPPSEYRTTFNSAEQALAKFDWMQASVLLDPIPTQALSANDSAYLAYLQARIQFILGNQSEALAELDRLGNSRIDPALRYRILSFKHYILEIQGDSLASAQLADQILRTAPGATRPAWKRSVWRNLQRTDRDALTTALPATADPQWRGWLELALITRTQSANTRQQLTRWQTDHAQHPAAKPLPGGLDYVVDTGEQRGKVALLLPLSGKLSKAGESVLNGYLAAYWADRAAGGAGNELLIIDVQNYASASSAYDFAVRQGATMVVGPLNKEGLADLGTQLERPVPILALNRIDDILPASGSALVQLSLSPEDEAQSLANLAFGTGARNALIISPSGEWGDKMQKALREQWASLGGSIVSSASYGSYEEYSSGVKSALALDASEQRARDLQSLFGSNVEYTPRRRQDADVVFLLSRDGAEARSIKPLLAFHYAGDLPVYALPSIYNGVPDERNQDLNGIRLVETPWLLGANPELRVTLAAGDNGGGYTQLNALGADAFLIQSGFGRLNSGADALFRGNTGLLSMDPKLQIQRALSPATFDGGELKPQ